MHPFLNFLKIRYNKNKSKTDLKRSVWANFTPIKNVEIFMVNDNATCCRAIDIKGNITFYNWDNHVDREIVYKTVTPDVLILIDSDVKRGWDINEYQ